MSEKEQNKIIVFITTETEKEAQRISTELLTKKKVACVNILPRVNSSFWWAGKVDQSMESLMIIKTREALLPDIITIVKKIHTYQVPEILALPIIGGNEESLNWIDEATTPKIEQ